MTVDWSRVASRLRAVASRRDDARLDEGQRASLRWIAQRIGHGGLVLADEVGTGKTRIACAVVHAVVAEGGRVAVVVPRGLMHQWATESRELDDTAPAPKRLTTFTEFLRGTSRDMTSAMEQSPCPRSPEWWLISHRLRAPVVRRNSYVWRAALPACIELTLARDAERQDGRTRIGRLHRVIASAPASWWGLRGMARIARDIAPLVRGRRDLLKRIEALPPLDLSTWNNDALREEFDEGRDGRPLTEALLGLWLGAFDLVVIDEAHKSRGNLEFERAEADAAAGTVLARLLEMILTQPEDGRRLCLTATPMELDMAQWFDLLTRAGCTLDEADRARVRRLPEAARDAQYAPDEAPRLQALCESAAGFTRVLAPYVTRRRRLDDPFVRSFCERVPPERRVLAHPHRRIEQVSIPWPSSASDAAWADVLFGAECLGRAAQGLTRAETSGWPASLQRAYGGLASGHLTADVLDAGERIEASAAASEDPVRAAKIARVGYWLRAMQDARHRASPGGIAPDSTHPRIAAAVSEIEAWTAKGEKVLVFGVFLAPMRRLRDVLNARHALRVVDAGQPLAHDPLDGAEGEALVRRQWALLREQGALRHGLATASDAALANLFARAHRRYESERRQVRREAVRVVEAWSRDASRLACEAPDSSAQALLIDHLVGFVVDHRLRLGAHMRADEELTEVFFDERLRPLFGEDEEDDDSASEAMDRWAKVLRALRGDTEGELGRQSTHARLLSGAMQRDETRKYLQASFNRDSADPHVLIAQSLVGREGLNLHGACRVVVQFHAEWNPAVLEQQIGRVDRKGGRWEALAREWIGKGALGEAPLIEVRRLVFEGTYDRFQWDRVSGRQRDFDASLFGALLPAESWERVPETWRDRLKAAAPSFTPEMDSTRKADVEHAKKRRRAPR